MPAIRFLETLEQEAIVSSLRFMHFLLEEVKNISSSYRQKKLIETSLKLKSELDFIRRESILQTFIENSLIDRKHKQFIRDLSEFKERLTYRFPVGEKKLTSSELN